MAITLTRTDWDPATGTHGAPRQVTEYEGRVIRVFNRDYRAMSDVYTNATFATVVEDDGRVMDVLVNANFECDLSNGRAVADASPLALLAYANHLKAQADARAEREAERRAEQARRERNRPQRGKRMRVVRGRKVKPGYEGTVAYVGDGRVLLKPHDAWQDRNADGVWVAPEYLEAM